MTESDFISKVRNIAGKYALYLDHVEAVAGPLGEAPGLRFDFTSRHRERGYLEFDMDIIDNAQDGAGHTLVRDSIKRLSQEMYASP